MLNQSHYPTASERTVDRAAEILGYIIQYKRDHDGVAPTFREIMAATGIKTTSTIAYFLNKLEVQGKIRLVGGLGSPRGIIVNGGKWTMEDD